jgi:hypothetical protein
MDVCVRLFLSVLFYVQVAALRRADPPSKESYRLCKRLRDWKSGQGPTKGCRDIDRYMNTVKTKAQLLVQGTIEIGLKLNNNKAKYMKI